jgi:serine/threonine protein kinase
VATGALTDPRPLQVLGQVLKGVLALHSQSFAHCNIKPSNILRRFKQHDWVLMDFARAAPLGSIRLRLCQRHPSACGFMHAFPLTAHQDAPLPVRALTHLIAGSIGACMHMPACNISHCRMSIPAQSPCMTQALWVACGASQRGARKKTCSEALEPEAMSTPRVAENERQTEEKNREKKTEKELR